MHFLEPQQFALYTPRPGEAPPQHEPKEVVLVRHGRSLAQEAGGRDRKTNPALTDCGLSREGERQARGLELEADVVPRGCLGEAGSDNTRLGTRK